MNRNFITISNPFSDTKTPVILNSSICRGCPYKVTPCQHIKKKVTLGLVPGGHKLSGLFWQ